MDFKSKPIILVSIVVAIVIAAGGFWYWQNKKGPTPVPEGRVGTPLDEETVSTGFGAQVLKKSQNPIKDKLPETNPFQTETNPLKNIYQNPF